ncbi:MAG: TonB-dependent receptor domain-containing protein, partial [Limisphaerales bacterium]
SYLARAWAAGGDTGRARKELDRAQALDPHDPTPWLVAGLLRRQRNEINDAVRDLERSLDLNDRRGVFRSRLGLDRDRALRSATLAPAYDDAGLPEAAEALASRAVTDDYANFAAHLFLAQSLAAREDPLRYDLGLETPRLNELLLANLLAPAGAGNLSPQFAQQDSLRLFRPPELGFSSLTAYRGDGHWAQAASAFGSLANFDYAVDAQFLDLDRQRPNSDYERLQFTAAARQRVTPDDHVYFQAGWARTEAGDVARYWDPADASPDLRVENEQAPLLVAGWQHRWSPANVTLALGTYAEDDLDLADPQRRLPFLRQSGGVITDIEVGRAVYDLDLGSRFRLGGAEVQHIWQAERFGVIAGARYQRGEAENDVTMAGPLPPPLADGTVTSDLERGGGYALGQFRPAEWLRLDAGIGYDAARFPRNADLPPFDGAEETRGEFTPRAGLTLAPAHGPLVQAAYGRSLGGLFFDPSLRLEPARLAGFNQAFRSLIPESVTGLVPGTLFESAGVRADHAFASDTYAGMSVEWRRSDGERDAGAVSNSLPLPLPDTPAVLTEALEFEERSLSVYVQQLAGRHWSLGARYRVSRAELETRLPGVPRTAAGLDALERDEAATLQQVTLSARWQHHAGWFARWESAWRHQDNDGYGGTRPPDDDFWQHAAVAGFRWPRRVAELQAGVLNLLDQDYRLNPLNAAPDLPRERTFFVSLRLNF